MCHHHIIAQLHFVIPQYNVERLIGQGGYGVVCIARDTASNRQVAMKVECGIKRTENECAAYDALRGIEGIPERLQSWTFQRHGILCIELLASDLEEFKRKSGGFLPVKEVFAFGRRLVQMFREVHARGVIHRDVKPSNILLSSDLKPYLTDFGHAAQWRDPKTGRHIEPYASSVGTPMFMSINAHRSIRCSRRDDMESLGYTLVCLAHGSLPWDDADSPQTLIQKKEAFRISQLSVGLPDSLQNFVDHTKSLAYDEEPQYAMLENLLHEAF